jgi:hypothetical protein
MTVGERERGLLRGVLRGPLPERRRRMGPRPSPPSVAVSREASYRLAASQFAQAQMRPRRQTALSLIESMRVKVSTSLPPVTTLW